MILPTRSKLLEENLHAKNPNEKKIVLKTSNAIWIVKTREILYCEADLSYTKFFLSNGKTILVSGNLMEFEEILRESGYFRAHKSFLVNLSEVVRFEKGDGGFLVMSNDDRSLWLQGKDELMDLFKKISG